MKVSPAIENLRPYTPGKPIEETKREFGLSEVVKLASNENPLGPSEDVVKAVTLALQETHRYPDASAVALSEKFRQIYDFAPEQMVFGNGSDELIDLIVRVFCEPGDQIVTSQATFMSYKIRSQACRAEVVELPFDANHAYDFDALEKLVETDWGPKKRLIFIANPNNPTGAYVNASRIQPFVDKVGGREDMLVIFDEAYSEFVRDPDPFNALGATKKHSNILTLRTLSKVYGLAGFRIGTLFGDARWMNYIHRVRLPFNVNSLAHVAAMAALEDEQYLKRSQQVNWDGLDFFYRELDELKLPYVRSQANFVFFDTLRDAGEVYQALLRRGVILRPMKGYGFDRHLRMSVGLPEENQLAIQALKEAVVEIPVREGV